MKNNLDKIYEGAVFGKPSIQLDPHEGQRVPQDIVSEREHVINTYLPARFHTNKNKKVLPEQKSTLREKFESKSNNLDQKVVIFLESYFKTERMSEFNSLDEILEDMYAYLHENQ
jgi:hypothetical protein